MQLDLIYRLGTVLMLAAATASAQKPYSITVQSGNLNRHQTPVWFHLPADTGNDFSLKDGSGRIHDLQVDAQGNACLIQNSLRAHDRANYKLVARDASRISGGDKIVSAQTISNGIIDLSIGGRSFLRYQGAKSALPRQGIQELYARGAYIHPVRSPLGVPLTDDYPQNHLHHHGIWWSWTKTEFEGRHPDFWNMGEGTGTVEFDSSPVQWSGPINGGFQSHHRFMDLTATPPKPVLLEDWQVTAYWIGRDVNTYWMFDLVSTQRCATDQPLKLPEYLYGGLGFRGNGQWDGADRCYFLTSEGVTNRVKAHGTRARWCDISGIVDGKYAGIAILSHPENFRAPQPMRVHPDQPFFNFAPQEAGDMEITPDKPYVSRYRFIVHDGPPIAARLNQFWDDFADPPKVDVQFSN